MSDRNPLIEYKESSLYQDRLDSVAIVSGKSIMLTFTDVDKLQSVLSSLIQQGYSIKSRLEQNHWKSEQLSMFTASLNNVEEISRELQDSINRLKEEENARRSSMDEHNDGVLIPANLPIETTLVATIRHIRITQIQLLNKNLPILEEMDKYITNVETGKTDTPFPAEEIISQLVVAFTQKTGLSEIVGSVQKSETNEDEIENALSNIATPQSEVLQSVERKLTLIGESLETNKDQLSKLFIELDQQFKSSSKEDLSTYVSQLELLWDKLREEFQNSTNSSQTILTSVKEVNSAVKELSAQSSNERLNTLASTTGGVKDPTNRLSNEMLTKESDNHSITEAKTPEVTPKGKKSAQEPFRQEIIDFESHAGITYFSGLSRTIDVPDAYIDVALTTSSKVIKGFPQLTIVESPRKLLISFKKSVLYLDWVLRGNRLPEKWHFISVHLGGILLEKLESISRRGFAGTSTLFNVLQYIESLCAEEPKLNYLDRTINLPYKCKKSQSISEHLQRVKDYMDSILGGEDAITTRFAVNLVLQLILDSLTEMDYDLIEYDKDFEKLQSEATSIEAIFTGLRRILKSKIVYSRIRQEKASKLVSKPTNQKSNKDKKNHEKTSKSNTSKPFSKKIVSKHRKEEQSKVLPGALKSNPVNSNKSKPAITREKGKVNRQSSSNKTKKNISSVRSDLNPPTENLVEPHTYDQAMRLPDADRWIAACDLEIKTIKERQVWKPMSKAQVRDQYGTDMANKLPIGSKWIFKRTLPTTTGEPIKYQARLVAQGFLQKKGLDYTDTFSGVVSIDTVLLMLAIAVQNKWHISQLHISSALLYGNLEIPQIMKQPEGYNDKTGRILVVTKALYGLKQSPREWYIQLSKILAKNGFKPVSDTFGLFFRVRKGITTCLLVYVDEILILSSDEREGELTLVYLKKDLDITELGFPQSYLSLNIERTNQGITVDCCKTVNSLLSEVKEELHQYKFNTKVPVLSSEVSFCFEIERNAKKPDYNPAKDCPVHLRGYVAPLSPKDQQFFQSTVGTLTYLVSRTRPDLAFATSQLSRHSLKPNKLHLIMLMRLLSYLEQTPLARLSFNRSGKKPVLTGYSDATFGEQGSHPQGGFIWKYGNNLFYWKSNRERGACSSNNEAELISLNRGIKYGIFIRSILTQMKLMTPDTEIIFHADSQSNLKITDRSKKTDIHVDKLKKQHQHNHVSVKRVAKEDNLAYVFTKPLDQRKFNRFTPKLLTF